MAMMGLRLAEGIDLGRYAGLAGAAMPEERVAELADLGLLARDGGRLRVTPPGRPLLDAVLRRLLA
jgi:coproporphyrinogen III oxidase-like Fe-S oxidoreductase